MSRPESTTARRSASAVWFQADSPGPWAEDAACRHHALLAACFTEATTFAEAAVGLSVCEGCLVREPCLAYGRALHADGVWGGQLLHAGSVRRR
jgi:hypothetical protein